jgi:hypothetical protein
MGNAIDPLDILEIDIKYMITSISWIYMVSTLTFWWPSTR